MADSKQLDLVAKRLKHALSDLEVQAEKVIQQGRFDHAIREKAVNELDHYIGEVSKIVKNYE